VANERTVWWLRRGLLLAGLAVAGWAATRSVLLLSGNEDVVSDDDYHGYFAIFSLVLLPVLVLAIATLLTDTIRLRRPADRSWRVVPGVALALSSPLAGSLALAAIVIGAAIVVTALMARNRATH
jgi:hypothetical protein